MNPMDCKQAQNVWSRVMAAQTAALCTNAEKAPEKTGTDTRRHDYSAEDIEF